MEQTKALNALEPFIALSKSATSPSAAADLITRATSHPNTFVFAELLETPHIQALATSPTHAVYLDLLQIFAWGTYQSYRDRATSTTTTTTDTPLPELNPAQTLKLRQLSLLTLARDRDGLTYSALQAALDLADTRALEDIVVSAIYAGLLSAKLDPLRQTVQVHSIAPLRDLAPGAIPDLTAALQAWSGRCTATLDDLDAEIANIRAEAAERQRQSATAEAQLDTLTGGKDLFSSRHQQFANSMHSSYGSAVSSEAGAKRLASAVGTAAQNLMSKSQRFGKRGSGTMMDGAADEEVDEAMDVDDDSEQAEGEKKRARNKRS